MFIDYLMIGAAIGAAFCLGFLIGTRKKKVKTLPEDIKNNITLPFDEQGDVFAIHRNLITKSSTDYEHNTWTLEGKLYDEAV